MTGAAGKGKVETGFNKRNKENSVYGNLWEKGILTEYRPTHPKTAAPFLLVAQYSARIRGLRY